MAKRTKEFEDTIPESVQNAHDLLEGQMSDKELFMLAYLIGDRHLAFHGSGTGGRYICGGYADALALLAKTAAETEQRIEDTEAQKAKERSDKAKAAAAARKKKPKAA